MEAGADEVVKFREVDRADLGRVRGNLLWHLGHLENDRYVKPKDCLDAMVKCSPNSLDCFTKDVAMGKIRNIIERALAPLAKRKCGGTASTKFYDSPT